MGFFDKMKDMAEDATKTVTSTSKSGAAKLDSKLKVNGFKKEADEAKVGIRKVHEKIGSMFLDEYENQIPMDDNKIQEAIEEIRGLKAKINDVDAKIKAEESRLEEKLQDIEREKFED